MGKKEKRIYLQAIVRRYRLATRKAKGLILDEFCSVCGYSRNVNQRPILTPCQRPKLTPLMVSRIRLDA